MEIIILDSNVYLDEYLVFMLKPDFDWNKLNRFFLKTIKLNSYTSRKCENLSDDEILAKMVVKKLASPSTFPKFNNEIHFGIKQLESAVNGVYLYRTVINPKIVSIEWDGEQWLYQLENIGHKTDYQKENLLINL